MRPDRHEFSVWVRAHHPDVGGDPERFAAGLDRWRAGAGEAGNVTVFRSRRGLWPIVRWARRGRRGRRRPA
ncbi:hypothetical protein NE235_27600 [Actinoallomurus spadix]|uniref:Uncharacterized protein n=1 Tax=Actinoallomurus spadix TaxID=79912 RepID=A0ABN0WIM1_9ACTN|nr:hypothetical protein [Actinoallomurus spadix]MCO5989884.1 hypothetical protein [Actinoallomurus spadix]